MPKCTRSWTQYDADGDAHLDVHVIAEHPTEPVHAALDPRRALARELAADAALVAEDDEGVAIAVELA